MGGRRRGRESRRGKRKGRERREGKGRGREGEAMVGPTQISQSDELDLPLHKMYSD